LNGFRFDAARHIYPDDRTTDSHAFWQWYRKELEKIKPDVYLIGEVFSVDRDEVAPYTSGLPSLFNFEMGKRITNAIMEGKDTIGIMTSFQEQLRFFHSVSPDFLDSPILTNHDQNRIGSELGGNLDKAKLAASILLTLPGAPYLYYGEELGMLGVKPDEFIREPFPWGEGVHTTTWMTPRYTTPEAVLTVQQQLKDENSILTHYKRLIAYRNSNPVLTKGNASPISGLPSEVVGLKRTFENDTLIVFHNISDVEVTLNLKNDFKDFNSISFSTHSSSVLNDGALTLAAYSTVVLDK
jgi:alpha-amylase